MRKSDALSALDFAEARRADAKFPGMPEPDLRKRIDWPRQPARFGHEEPAARPGLAFVLGVVLWSRSCKAFNAKTQGVEPGLVLPVVITAFADKSFTFEIKSPPATVLIKKAAKIDKGSQRPHLDKVCKLNHAQLEEIAKTKMKDLNAADMEGAVRIIAGSARSMGIIVEGV